MVDLTFHWIYFEIIVYCADLDYCCTNDIGRMLPLLELQFLSSYCIKRSRLFNKYSKWNFRWKWALIDKKLKSLKRLQAFLFRSWFLRGLFFFFVHSLVLIAHSRPFSDPITFGCSRLNAFFFSFSHFMVFIFNNRKLEGNKNKISRFEFAFIENRMYRHESVMERSLGSKRRKKKRIVRFDGNR